jgi:hypothetical protein
MTIFALKVNLIVQTNPSTDRGNVLNKYVLKIIFVLKVTLKDLHPPK